MQDVKLTKSQYDTVEAPQATLSMHPKKFLLWLFIVTIVMLFSALTSAYIVRQGEGDWLDFDMPVLFWVNTGLLLLSSVTLHVAYLMAKKDRIDALKVLVAVTTLLGLAFLAGQYVGWGDLVEMGVYLVGNPSGSFMYVITGLHAVHLISGVLFLLVVFVQVFRNRVHAKRLTLLEMGVTYWHFLDGLWLYLFLFLLLNR
ncbi:MAG: cytochrome c oxidase subunit 3 [Catalinimonas sp.]